LLAVPLLAPVILFGFIFKNNNFLVFYMAFHHGADLGSCHIGGPHCNVLSLGNAISI
jgi:hypothetical protein